MPGRDQRPRFGRGCTAERSYNPSCCRAPLVWRSLPAIVRAGNHPCGHHPILQRHSSILARTATFTCSTQLSPYQRVNILGATGRIEIEIPVNAPAKRPTRIWYAHDSVVDELVFEVCNQYTLQGDVLSRAILEDTPVPTPLADAVANMRVIDAVVRSGREGNWVKLGY